MVAFQMDLFSGPVLAGLAQGEDFVTADEERALVAQIDRAELSPFRFQGWIGKRLTASFGWHYDFNKATFQPTDPIPDWLLPLRQRAASFADLPPDEFVQALLIRYDPGAGIAWHRDRSCFEHVVASRLERRRRCASVAEDRAASIAVQRRWRLGRFTI
jgi:alkylated DNA repair dioxygenase AlkB